MVPACVVVKGGIGGWRLARSFSIHPDFYAAEAPYLLTGVELPTKFEICLEHSGAL